MPLSIDLGHGKAVGARDAGQGQKLAQGREHGPRLDAVGADERAEAVHAAAAHGEDEVGAGVGEPGDALGVARLGKGGGETAHGQGLPRRLQHLAAGRARTAAAAPVRGAGNGLESGTPAHSTFFPMGSGAHSPRISQPSQSAAIVGAMASQGTSLKPRAR